jgi:hypothetical protein
MPYETDIPDPSSLMDAAGRNRATSVARTLNMIKRRAEDHLSPDDPEPPKQNFIPLQLTSNVTDADGFFYVKRFLPPCFPDKSGPIETTDLGTIAEEEDGIAVAVSAVGCDHMTGLHVGYDEETSKAIYLVLLANSIEVDLSNPAGSAGVNKTSPCTYTYTCKIAGTDIQVGTGLTPGYSPFRAMDLQLTAATTGRGCFIDGSFVLRVADEAVAGSQKCS